jgi:hypothetical protein
VLNDDDHYSRKNRKRSVDVRRDLYSEYLVRHADGPSSCLNKIIALADTQKILAFGYTFKQQSQSYLKTTRAQYKDLELCMRSSLSKPGWLS